MKRNRVIAWAVIGVFSAAAIGAYVVARRGHPAAKSDETPLTVVKRGAIDLRVYTTGELRASHSIMLTAPAIGGDSLQITRLSRTGEVVKKGDVIIEFDPSEQHYKLEQNRSELHEAEQEIVKAKADAAVLTAEDKVALLKARYGVRRAELDVQKNELLSKIDGQKNDLALQQAKRVLAELEKDIESHKASGQASIYLSQEKYNKAKLAMDQAEENLGKMQVKATMDGVVSIQKNENASGGFYFTGMSLPDFHPGDQVEPGSSIAQIVDPAGMEVATKVGEQARDNVKAGQVVEVNFDALPGKTFHGTVKGVGGMSMRQFFEANSGGNFEVTIQLTDPDARLRSGFTAQILFVGESKKNVLYLPRQAIFLKDGKRVVYVSKGSGYDQRVVTVRSQSESRAEVDGVEEGTKVALIDPTAPRKTAAAASTEGKP